MTIRKKGPIGPENLIQFTVSSTFRIPNDRRTNRNRISCKICGGYVEKGEAKEIFIVGMVPSQLSSYFLCEDCNAFVEKSIKTDARFTEESNERDKNTN